MATKIEETNKTPDYIFGLKNCSVCYEHFVKNEKLDMCPECLDAFIQPDSVVIAGNWGADITFHCNDKACRDFKLCLCFGSCSSDMCKIFGGCMCKEIKANPNTISKPECSNGMCKIFGKCECEDIEADENGCVIISRPIIVN